MDDTMTCPLCHAVLSGFDGNRPESAYPDVDVNVHGYNFITRIFMFLSIVGGIAAVVTNYLAYDGVLWSVLAVASILYLWAGIAHSIRHHVNVASKILVQVLCASVLVVLVDLVLGYDGWSVNYLVPLLFGLANIAVLILLTINRLDWRNYLMYQLGIALLGFVPIILYLCGAVDRPLITMIATVISSLTLIGTMIFGERKVESELKRRFHF